MAGAWPGAGARLSPTGTPSTPFTIRAGGSELPGAGGGGAAVPWAGLPLSSVKPRSTWGVRGAPGGSVHRAPLSRRRKAEGSPGESGSAEKPIPSKACSRRVPGVNVLDAARLVTPLRTEPQLGRVPPPPQHIVPDKEGKARKAKAESASPLGDTQRLFRKSSGVCFSAVIF